MTDKVLDLDQAWEDGSLIGMWVEIHGERTRVINKLQTVPGGFMVQPPVERSRFWKVSDIDRPIITSTNVGRGTK